MTTQAEYALLAAGSYWDIRKPDPDNKWNNQAPLPDGWEILTQFDQSGSGENAKIGYGGFSARVFRNKSTQEVVISYGGTEFEGNWLGTGLDFKTGNIPLAIGLFGEQAARAAILYEDVRRSLHTSSITFTGHSLGGGLASLMSIWANRPAYVFAQAPFEPSTKPKPFIDFVDSPGLWALIKLNNTFTFSIVKERLKGAFVEASLDPQIMNYVWERDYQDRERNITSVAVQGELLEAYLPVLGARFIELENSRRHLYSTGSTDLGASSKHSIDLHAAALLSRSFESEATKISTTLPIMFNPELYGYKAVYGTAQNFLVKLIRGQVGVRDDSGNLIVAPNEMLTYFADDLKSISDAKQGLKSNALDALIAQTIEWYYWQDSSTYSKNAFFKQFGSVLQYSTAIGDNLVNAQDKAKDYVFKWLSEVSNDNKVIPESSWSKTYQQWSVATGEAIGVSATARDLSKRQIFIGQNGSDSFTGGDLDDLMLAGGGNDTLNGGIGSDILVGG